MRTFTISKSPKRCGHLESDKKRYTAESIFIQFRSAFLFRIKYLLKIFSVTDKFYLFKNISQEELTFT